MRDTDFDEPVFQSTRMFEKGGVSVAVIGQAFPYTPIANPRWMMPNWSFGIREDDAAPVRGCGARGAGAEVVVLLSHNGFDVDRKLAGRVDGIDVILTGHTHDALPAAGAGRPTRCSSPPARTASSSRAWISRSSDGRVTDFAYALIPVLADAIAPDPAMAQLIAGIRAPHEAMLATELARTEGLLYRRGTFAGTLDDLICDAVLDAARRRDLLLARLPLGPHAAARPADHLGRCLQRHRHHLSRRLPHRHDGRGHQGRRWRAWPTTCSIPIPERERS